MGNAEFSTLNELFLRAIEAHPKPDCFLFKAGGQYRGLASSEALRRVAALATALERLGVKRGDRVALLSENRVEWALTDYAILGLGAITVPIYTTLLEPDVEYIVRDSEVQGIVVATDVQLQKALNIRGKLPGLKFILGMDCAKSAGTGAECWEASVETELGLGGPLIESFRTKALAAWPNDAATVLYTSGTMGQAKGVILTHANLVSNVLACQDLFALGTRDVGMSFLPLSHVFERMLDYTYFSKGVSIAYAESFEALPQNLREVSPTTMAVVPRVLEKIQEKVIETVRQYPAAKQNLFYWALGVGRGHIPYRLENRNPPRAFRLKHAFADRLVFSKVREQLGGRVETLISGAAPLSRDLAEFFYAIGLAVYEGYGLTETSPVIAVNYPGHVRLGTVGQVIAGVEVKLGEASEDEEAGSGREILVRGPNVTPGYYHLEEENRQAFVDGWFRTGDLGTMDADGYLSITGREKNLFKTSGGKYVSPEKLENIFQGHPYIHQIVVLGDKRKFVGALIVPNFARLEKYARQHEIAFTDREELVMLPEINTFMQQQIDEATRWLPPHERVRQIVLLPKEFTMDSGELSATLKVKRRVVEERYRELIEELFSRHAPPVERVSATSSSA
ncbi:MAG: long-chain fatty acid--CoA ligase [Acidobacteriia bacterium]|nr:long-chain fatty acid--CoA ligase [Terriglobia bacterium]